MSLSCIYRRRIWPYGTYSTALALRSFRAQHAVWRISSHSRLGKSHFRCPHFVQPASIPQAKISTAENGVASSFSSPLLEHLTNECGVDSIQIDSSPFVTSVAGVPGPAACNRACMSVSIVQVELPGGLSPRRNRQRVMMGSILCVAWLRASLGEGASFDPASLSRGGEILKHIFERPYTGSMQSRCAYGRSQIGELRASTPLSLAQSNALSPIGSPQIFSRHAVEEP